MRLWQTRFRVLLQSSARVQSTSLTNHLRVASSASESVDNGGHVAAHHPLVGIPGSAAVVVSRVSPIPPWWVPRGVPAPRAAWGGGGGPGLPPASPAIDSIR